MKVQPIKSPMMLGNLPVKEQAQLSPRMVILLWGLATCGKSTFAATAPGDKLWLAFGDNEHASVAHRNDVIVAELFGLSLNDLFSRAQKEDPFGLDKFLSENTRVETVVCDSLTAISFMALQKAVYSGLHGGKGFTPTMEAPGRSAYGGRNAVVLEVVQGLMKVTAKHGVHLVVTAHEDDPVMSESSGGTPIIQYITIMLGGKLVNNMSYRFSEIWHLRQESTGINRRKLRVNNTTGGNRRPMKSRMFANHGASEFVLDYDADKPDAGQMTIASWHKQWVDNKYKKLPVP